MTPGARSFRLPLAVLAVAVLLLTGCATANLEQSLARTNKEAASFTGDKLSLARNDDEQEKRRLAASTLLSAPLGQKEAVQLALVNSPALQALLAQNWADSARVAQSGRIANPVFNFQRIAFEGGLDIERTLAFGLLDLLTLPQRQRVADQRMEQAQLTLTGDVIDQVTLVRQAWVRAVTAQQIEKYANQVNLSAEASAELARRMEAAGNFNKLTRARHQTFYADAATRLASARQEARSTREKLIRLLGLDDAQAQQLKLPERLPELPKQPHQPEQVAQKASAGRLDIRLAQVALNSAATVDAVVAPDGPDDGYLPDPIDPALSGQEIVDAIAAGVLDPGPIIRLLGGGLEDGRFIVRTAEWMGNHFGTMHGGLIAAIVGQGISFAAQAHTAPGVGYQVTDMSVGFYRSPELGGEVVVDVEPVKVGRRIGSFDATMRTRDGLLLSKASADARTHRRSRRS